MINILRIIENVDANLKFQEWIKNKHRGKDNG